MQNIFIDVLPPWVETGLQPAFYDLESGTVLQQTARMYAKMRELGVAFNTFTADVTEKVNHYINEFHELYTYVHDYFDNLDVQEEINHKLEIMAEDGTLATIVNEYLETSTDIPTGEIKFKNLNSYKFSTTDLYEGAGHYQLQGSCYVNGNMVCALINPSGADNYTRLVEIEIATGRIIRSTYLTLNHANSLSYREDNGKIYVAACGLYAGDQYIDDNRIFVVDYEEFTLDQTINVGNIPAGHRIRSVWYDNEDGILYAGDEHDMFIIDESNYSITETIELETTYINTDITNQTLKKHGEFYYGVYLTYIAIWNRDKKCLKVIPLEQTQQNEHLGEVEDICFDEDNNLLLTSTHRLSPRLPYWNVNIYKTNISRNIDNVLEKEIHNSDTTAIPIYVDSESEEDFENGSSQYPYKNLQRAVNYANRTVLPSLIYVKAGNYDYTYINGNTNLNIVIDGNSTIDGLEVRYSNVVIYNTNESTLSIAGVSSSDSDLSFEYYGENKLTITPNTHSGTLGEGKCVYVRGGHVKFLRTVFTGTDEDDVARFAESAIVSLDSCTFDGYEGHYAIECVGNSIVTTYECTYAETISSTQHNFLIREGSRFYHRNASADKNNFTLETQGMDYPSANSVTPTHEFYGEVCDDDYHYNYILFEYKVGGATAKKETALISHADLETGDAMLESTWIQSGGVQYSAVYLNITDGKITITENRKIYQGISGGSMSYSNLSNDTPSTPANWIAIKKVVFCSI